MTAIDAALPRLKTEEGFRATAYRDTEGHETIGYGFNVEAGISRYAAGELLTAQLKERHDALMAYPWYAALDAPRQSVCLDIAYNDGLEGLLNFPHLLAALAKQDWQTAAAECHVKNPELAARYRSLADIILTGEI